MEITQRNQEIWTEFHGGKLSEFFNRSVASYFSPRAVMRRNVLVFDTMKSLEVLGLLDNKDAVKKTSAELHSELNVFRKSPYAYASGSELSLLFSIEHMRDQLENFYGRKVILPSDYKEEFSRRIHFIRGYGRSSHLRRVLG